MQTADKISPKINAVVCFIKFLDERSIYVQPSIFRLEV